MAKEILSTYATNVVNIALHRVLLGGSVQDDHQFTGDSARLIVMTDRLPASILMLPKSMSFRIGTILCSAS
jgi:hypothetical protein